MNVHPLPIDPYASVPRLPQFGNRPDAQKAELPPLRLHPASLRLGNAIPPREWLYGHFLIRRYITLLVAPGGVGKTAWTIACATALAYGQKITGDWVHKKTKVLICTLEDPEDELDRRIAAVLIHHQIKPEDVDGHLFVISGRDRQLRMASLDSDGTTVCFPDKLSMTALCKEHDIGVIVVDPFVNSHELDENSNPQVNAAARAWAEVANDTQSAVLLVHHTRKGAIAGDADSGRGASSLVNAARVSLTLTAMSEDEAKGFGIPANERRLHIRLDDAKANLAPPSEKARWFRLASVALGNGTPEYPHGDNVQAVEAWEPPVLMDNVPSTDLNALLDRIAAGPGGGSLYSGSNRGRSNERYVGTLIASTLSMTDEQAKKIIAAWLKSGLLTETRYHDPGTRKEASGLVVDNSKRPS